MKRETDGMSIVHSFREPAYRAVIAAFTLTVLLCVVVGRFEPAFLIVLVAVYPSRRMESLRITQTGVEFTGGPSFTREKLLRAYPTTTGEVAFDFHGGQSHVHFERLSPIQAEQIVEEIGRFLAAPRGPSLPLPTSPQR